MLPTGESTPRNEGWERQMTDHSSTACLLRLQWDETNLTLHEIEREQQEARMKIDEPKTPFVHGTSIGPVGDDDGKCAAQVALSDNMRD
jgi:hypothetical protein